MMCSSWLKGKNPLSLKNHKTRRRSMDFIKTFKIGLLTSTIAVAAFSMGLAHADDEEPVGPVELSIKMDDDHHHHHHDDDHHHHRHNPVDLAIALDTEFWTAVQNHDTETLGRLISTRLFQGASIATGVVNEAQLIAILNALSITGFSLNNVAANLHEKVLTVSYVLIATGATPLDELILETWRKDDGKWRLVSQAVFPLLAI